MQEPDKLVASSVSLEQSPGLDTAQGPGLTVTTCPPALLNICGRCAPFPGLEELTQRTYWYLAHDTEPGSQYIWFSPLHPSSFPCILPFTNLSSHPAKNKNSKARVGLEHDRVATTLSPFFPSTKTQLGGILNSSSKHSQMDMTGKRFRFGTVPNSSIIY